jgi:hypothetical protein
VWKLLPTGENHQPPDGFNIRWFSEEGGSLHLLLRNGKGIRRMFVCECVCVWVWVWVVGKQDHNQKWGTTHRNDLFWSTSKHQTSQTALSLHLQLEHFSHMHRRQQPNFLRIIPVHIFGGAWGACFLCVNQLGALQDTLLAFALVLLLTLCRSH